jgi:UDP-glucose 4-epimerase
VKALVTGGAGFIGSHIVDSLIAEGHDVAALDNLVTGKRENLAHQPSVRLHEIDIVDARRVRRVLMEERPDVVFHEAAQMSVKVSTDRPVYDAEVNIVGLLNVLRASVDAGVRKVVFASSGATYGNPQYLPMDELHPQLPGAPYGITKMAAEHYLRYFQQDCGLAFTSLRYGNVYGPRQDAHGEAGVVAIFTTQLLEGRTPTIHWDGEQVRDYVFVRDVARANVCAMGTAGDGRSYGIGTGVGTTVNEVYRLLCEHLGIQRPPNRSPRRAGDLRAAYFDTRRAREELRWTPAVSLGEGLAETAASFRDAVEGSAALAA